MKPELIVLSLNFIIICIGYLWIYPKAAGSDIKKISVNDAIASLTSLAVAGTLFWGTAYEFDAIFFSLNWFWFTLLSFLVIEIPFGIWYIKRFKVLDNLDP